MTEGGFSPFWFLLDETPHMKGDINMSITERSSQHPKNETGDQLAPQAPKASRAKGLNALLETVRQKMAYTIRGI